MAGVEKQGVLLKFYMGELDKHAGILKYQWLLEFAKNKGITGGTCSKAIAGFGSSGKMYEEHFFELASKVPITVEFLMKRVQVDDFLETLSSELPGIFYVISEASFGKV